MAKFECPVVRVKIEPHPNADQIEIALVGDYKSIVRKDQFKNGDLAVYIPEQALVPEWLLKKMKLWDAEKEKGGLHGSTGDRVKAIKLRGIVSQGLLLDGWNVNELLVLDSPVVKSRAEGIRDDETVMFGTFIETDDAADFLGIKKYEPPLPSHMQGRIVGADLAATHKYDFENIKKRPTLFEDGEEVVITEKIHGTLMQIGVVPTSMANEKYYGGRVTISSKGLGGSGYVLAHDDKSNLYAQAAASHDLFQGALEVFGKEADFWDKPIFILGEVFGKTVGGAGVQDLWYSHRVLDFRVFDICLGAREEAEYVRHSDMVKKCEQLGVKHVPVLYQGPYSKQAVLDHTDGLTTLVAPRGAKTHIREGVVIKSANESKHKIYGRKIAKSISDAYLLRKNADATEFQ